MHNGAASVGVVNASVSVRCSVRLQADHADCRRTMVSPIAPGARSPEPETMNIQQMMKQAQQMQERLQKQMTELRVEASAGGGMISVVVNGTKQIQSITIDP